MNKMTKRIMMIGTEKGGRFYDALRARKIKFNLEHRDGNAIFSYLADDKEQAELWSVLRA